MTGSDATGSLDAGSLDAGSLDAGSLDAGSLDLASSSGAGQPNGGYGQHRPSARSRAISAGLVIALHAGAVAGVLAFAPPIARVIRPVTLTAVNFAASPAPATRAQSLAAPAKPVQPHRALRPARALIRSVISAELADRAAFAVAVQASAAAAGAPDCDLTEPVQAALAASPAVQAALPHIPADQRSIANAITVWSQTWVQTADSGAGPAFAIIRDTIARTVLAASDQCRSQVQGGPRLVYLDSGGAQTGAGGTRNGLTAGAQVTSQTVVLALGSGQWTWQQVADSAQPGFGLPAAALPAGASPGDHGGAAWASASPDFARVSANRFTAATVTFPPQARR